eukprot:2369742-Prymnesium_polylepis.2
MQRVEPGCRSRIVRPGIISIKQIERCACTQYRPMYRCAHPRAARSHGHAVAPSPRHTATHRHVGM